MNSCFQFHLLLFFVCLFSACSNNSTKEINSSPNSVHKDSLQADSKAVKQFIPAEEYVYTGYIDKYSFTMKLTFKETIVSGYYFYQKRDKQIFLEGSFKDNILKLTEVGDENPEIFEGTGEADKSSFNGNWRKNNTANNLNFYFTLPPKNEDVDYSKELQSLVSSYNDDSHDTIPKELADLFIATALEGEYTCNYSDGFSYTKGAIEYENENFVALSFKKEGDTGFHTLDVDFIFTINKKNGQVISQALVGSSSDYEWHFQRGYNKYENINYTVKPLKNDRLAFKILCEESSTYYNFNRDYVDEKEEPEEEREEKSSFYFEVDSYGRFSYRLES